MRMLFFIFFCLFCISCTSTNGRTIIPDNEKAVNKQLTYSEKMLSTKYHIRPCASTVAMPEGDIQYLELEFEVKGQLSKSEIRKLLIDLVHDFLCNINSDKELCYYLKNGHLKISEIGITLFLRDQKNRPIAQPEIGVAFIDRGILTFVNVEPEAIPSFKVCVKETYEEALSILKNECSAIQ